MRKMKGSNSYLRNQTWKNLVKATVCLILFGVIFFALSYRVLSTLQLGVFEVTGLALSLIPLAAFYFYMRQYRIYKGGLEGEKRVAKLLSASLSDDYILINGVQLSDDYGDIDHIILGPNGLFVLETKNWKGKITCHGDEWQREGRRNFKTSPSRQVKKNTAKIKRLLESSKSIRPLSIYVEGIIVFTNNHASLNLNNPTVLALKLRQLPNHITMQKGISTYSQQQLEAIGKVILKQAS